MIIQSESLRFFLILDNNFAVKNLQVPAPLQLLLYLFNPQRRCKRLRVSFIVHREKCQLNFVVYIFAKSWPISNIFYQHTPR